MNLVYTGHTVHMLVFFFRMKYVEFSWYGCQLCRISEFTKSNLGNFVTVFGVLKPYNTAAEFV